jgi:hypothetical protein
MALNIGFMRDYYYLVKWEISELGCIGAHLRKYFCGPNLDKKNKGDRDGQEPVTTGPVPERIA